MALSWPVKQLINITKIASSFTTRYLKLEFAEIHAPKYPHLVDQLELLADVIEDYAEGADQEIPYFVIAEAAFALAYAHNQTHLIPDHVADIGFADESAVVRTVMIENEKALSEYCKRHGLDFAEVTTEA